MAEKLFVIAGLKIISAEGDANYTLADGRGYLHLPSDAVIPASRLRYGPLEYKGQRFFTTGKGWDTADDKESKARDWLILDPPEPVDEWDAWVEDMPDAVPDYRERGRLMKEWFRRMPRGK